MDALTAAGYQGDYDVELMGEDIDASCYQSLLEQSKQAYGKLVEVYGDVHPGDEVASRGTDELRPGTRVSAKPVAADAQGTPK